MGKDVVTRHFPPAGRNVRSGDDDLSGRLENNRRIRLATVLWQRDVFSIYAGSNENLCTDYKI
jgi:hypothetical protein